jgi:hypothetical protein
VMILTSLGARFWSSFLPLLVLAVLNSDIFCSQIVLQTKKRKNKEKKAKTFLFCFLGFCLILKIIKKNLKKKGSCLMMGLFQKWYGMGFGFESYFFI